MIWDKLVTAPCVIPVATPVDPRCKDSAFSLANPSLCAGASLLLKPGVAMLCELESVQFRVFDYLQGVETELLTGVRFTTSNGEVFALGINTGNGTALVGGSVTITATHTDGRTAQAELTVLPGTRCCDDIRVLTSIVVDNSKSMSHAFPGYTSRLGFTKALATSYGGVLYEINGIPKDADQVWTVNAVTTALLTGFSDDVDAITDAIAGIAQTQAKTDLLPVFTTVTDDLLAGAADRRVVLLVSDGEQTSNTDRQAVITAANTFKSLGGIVIVIGVRASGQGYDLLERVATGGFFLNALASNASDVLSQLNYLKSILCAGFCIPAGDEFVNLPATDYSSFENWEVTAGNVNLAGEDLLNFLAVSGLYVELNSGTPATIRTIDQYALVAGRSYRIALDAAGNQREAIAGQGIKIYVREVGVNDSDPNIFEQVIYPAWDSTLQSYSFSFNSTVSASVRLYVEQLYTGAAPIIGNFIDNVKFEETTTLITLLNDTFDGENLTYIPPRCGLSAGLAAIDDPEEPTIEWVADGGEDLNIHAQFLYGITYLTNEGETAVATVEYERTDTFGYSQTVRKLTIPQSASGRVVGVRIWRSLGEVVLDPTATDLFLLAEVLPGQTTYFDQEGEAAFTARYEPSVEAPVVNTTAAAAGASSNYTGCCYESVIDYGAGENVVPTMTSNTEPSGVVSSGTAITSEGDWWFAFDRELGNTWFGDSNAVSLGTEWIQFRFTTGPKIITAYRLTSHVIEFQTAPSGWVLRGSNNGTTWTDLDTKTGITGWVDYVSRTFYIPSPGSYAYYRITFTAVEGDPAVDLNFSVAEFELLAGTTSISTFIDNCPPCEVGTPGVQVAEFPALGNIETSDPPPPVTSVTVERCATCPAGFINLGLELVPAMTSNTTPSGTASASAEQSSPAFPAWQAFDNTSSPWSSTAAAPQWVQYQFTAAKTVRAYGVRSYKGQPSAFTLQGSTDGTTWIDLDSRTAQAFSGLQTKRYLITTPASYAYYRLRITAYTSVADALYPNIAELELFEVPTTGPCASATASNTADAATAALAAASLNLNCVPVYTRVGTYLATCETGFGNPESRSVTKTSLNSPEEAQADADAAAQEAAEDALDCEQSNNEQSITIHDSSGGFSKASPYPSVSFQEGHTGVITDVTVEIFGFTHQSPDDVRIVLVSPAGTKVELMRNCGGHPVDAPAGTSAVSGIDITFDDAAGSFLPDGPGMVGGTFKPTQFGVAANLPSPCPATPYLTTLAAFDGQSGNGAWSLFCVDDLSAFSGSISGGWDLTITSA